VREETQAWASEFRSVLKQIDEAAVKAARAKALGAIQVEVSNGDQVTGTWTLRIDDESEHVCSGKRASITGVLPGIRKVSVIGEIGGRALRAEAAVIVPEAGVGAVSLTLA
jgi:hypothetical protein